MTDGTKEPEVRPLAWTVVCKNFVSVHRDHADAVLHAAAIFGKQCKEKHTVAQTNLPYGTRHEGKYSK